MRLTAPTIRFAARVSVEDKDALENILPLHGAQQWLVQEGLRMFLAHARLEPGCLPACRAAILRSNQEFSQPTPWADFYAKIGRHEYDEFNTFLPEKGATAWFIRTLLREFIIRAESRGLRLRVELAEARDAMLANVQQTWEVSL